MAPISASWIRSLLRYIGSDSTQPGEVAVNSLIADLTAFWWNERKPDVPMLWESKIKPGEKFFQEIIQHPFWTKFAGKKHALLDVDNCLESPRSVDNFAGAVNAESRREAPGARFSG